MEKSAGFQLMGFYVNNCTFDFDVVGDNSEGVDGNFKVNGEYQLSEAKFQINIIFEAKIAGEDFCKVECVGGFQFDEGTTYENIPPHFFTNALAIVFPYIRAFVGNLSSQSNGTLFVLPTLNLSNRGEELKTNTKIHE